MSTPIVQTPVENEPKPRHAWLKKVHVAFVPDFMDPMLEESVDGLLDAFARLGHTVQSAPSDETDVLLTTAPFGEPVNWRRSLLLTGRARLHLKRNPTVFALVHIQPAQLQGLLDHFSTALAKEPADPADFEFAGLSSTAFKVLLEQGRRGGPIMAVERLLQAQTKNIRILLLVGEDRPAYVHHFDLVGAHPISKVNGDPLAMYDDMALRIVTTVSTRAVTDHEMTGELIPYDVWRQMDTPRAMGHAARELGKRQFFTEMVRISELVPVPAVGDVVASQYSEGCFATWEPGLDALIATITGSARPVDKDNITEDDLAVLVGVREGGVGAIVRHVEGKRNDPPSSEAVEMMELDFGLPRINLGPDWPIQTEAPVVRSKLHGHRGVAAYDPQYVEYVPLDPPYFHYLVSCATEAQAHAVKGAFSRSQALLDPDDPRQIAFTILPGHGLVAAEKWVPGKAPFQLMWEAMDAGHWQIESYVPQGVMCYVPDGSGQVVLQEE